ncbi:MAG: hypothetical protein Q9190_005075 [Brigantiaea leucoxantha]
MAFADLEKEILPVIVRDQIFKKEIRSLDVPFILNSTATHDTSLSYSSDGKAISPQKDLPKLPVKHEGRAWRQMRYNLMSVYKRLFFICLAANIIALVVFLVGKRRPTTLGLSPAPMATAVASNILAAFLIRQENVINSLYTICCWTPLWFPLRFRRMIAKLYHFGGVHSGCAVSATIWFMLLIVLITRDFVLGNFNQPAILTTAYVLLVLLVSICASAIPKFRNFSHNTFEAVHRFAGWTAVGLFWVLVILLSRMDSKALDSPSLGTILVKTPALWILVLITFFTILPWLRLRKVEAFPEVLSDHVVRIRFDYMRIGPMRGLRISTKPLKEWHTFASIPAPDGRSFSLIVSNAGDWTNEQIMQPANAYWVRGIPITGVLRMALVFRKVVIVTTGSGIGPVLSMLVSFPLPCRLLWSTRDPEVTYGEEIMHSVYKADPDAVIINTRASGYPDMVALTHGLYQQSRAEAVFCISNRTVTSKVIYEMESRGVPAYGPIFDS